MNNYSKKLITLLTFLTLVTIGAFTVFAATAPDLGEADSFSILAQTAITGTGTIDGDVGMNSTGAAITDLTAGMVGGTIFSTDGVAPGLALLDADVQADAAAEFNVGIPGQASTTL